MNVFSHPHICESILFSWTRTSIYYNSESIFMLMQVVTFISTYVCIHIISCLFHVLLSPTLYTKSRFFKFFPLCTELTLLITQYYLIHIFRLITWVISICIALTCTYYTTNTRLSLILSDWDDVCFRGVGRGGRGPWLCGGGEGMDRHTWGGDPARTLTICSVPLIRTVL